MLSLTSGKLKFSVSEDASAVEWSAVGTPLRQSPNADFWRAFFDDGYEMEMSVCSSKQKGKAVLEDNVISIEYPSLLADNGRVFDVTFKITVCACTETYSGFRFSSEITNRGRERFNEIMLPFVDLAVACDSERQNDVFYHIEGLGKTIPNPWDTVRRTSHTEYISSDNHVVWNSQRYPGDAAMGWFGLETGGHFLYMGRHDPELKICVLNVGVSPRNAEPRLMMNISHLPCAKQGETVKTTECFVSLNEGDWKKGSDIYSGYARANWYTPPVVPEWVKNITGWQRIILRHQFGEVNYTYEDLPRLYENGKKYGLNMLLSCSKW